MNIVDYIILVIMLLMAWQGFKRGVLNSIVTFGGTLIVIILAFYVKNPISAFLYQNFPFFNLGGRLDGLTIFNILIYEGIAYVIAIIALGIILKIVASATGIIEAFLKMTIVLGFPSKILGAILGLFQGYIVAFITVFLLSTSANFSSNVQESEYGMLILEKTPFLSGIVGNTHKAVTEIFAIVSNREQYEISDDVDDPLGEEKNANIAEDNLKSLEILLKYEIISVSSAEKLLTSQKITIPGADELVAEFKERSQ